MAEKIKVTYLGYCVELLQLLKNSVEFQVKNTVGVKGRMSETQIAFIQENEIPYKEISEKNEIMDISGFLEKSDIAIIYKFEFIIPQVLVDQYTFFNFHGGNLRTNRGAHAVVWSILNREKSTCLTLYKLTGGIDVGIVIGEYFVEIKNSDTPYTLNKKLREGIPDLLILLKDYLQGKIEGKLISEGIYRRKIKEEDYTIDCEKDSFADMRAKINSQAAYDGAVLWYKGKKYQVLSILYDGAADAARGKRSIKITGEKCMIEEQEKQIVLEISAKS